MTGQGFVGFGDYRKFLKNFMKPEGCQFETTKSYTNDPDNAYTVFIK